MTTVFVMMPLPINLSTVEVKILDFSLLLFKFRVYGITLNTILEYFSKLFQFEGCCIMFTDLLTICAKREFSVFQKPLHVLFFTKVSLNFTKGYTPRKINYLKTKVR